MYTSKAYPIFLDTYIYICMRKLADIYLKHLRHLCSLSFYCTAVYVRTRLKRREAMKSTRVCVLGSADLYHTAIIAVQSIVTRDCLWLQAHVEDTVPTSL